ncbi:MAG TPA: pyridoxal-phosphate dependent enzyme [Gemmatimonadaceae bacterium]|nr:pyridoxal-phosphate dependent enzyme [Gemmatimonadaceae bacterium]
MPSTVTLPTSLSLDAIETTRERIRGIAVRTPLITVEGLALKLETLQPIGSFKIRGAAAALASGTWRSAYTASAGNMAQGVAWVARVQGIPATAIVPESAPVAKTSAVERLGGTVIKVSPERWWQVFEERSYPGLDGRFVHPFADVDVMTGNATIALEILEDMPDVDTVLVPFGGGGLACGIALGLRAAGSSARVLACEVETAAPFAASLRDDRASRVDRRPSFVDGIGGQAMLEEMWPLAKTVLAGTVVNTVADIATALRWLVERAHVVAEGAGAASVAAARSAKRGERVVCVISGGNIDLPKLATILNGGIPS